MLDRRPSPWPRITVVVATLNEAVLIPGKLRNLAATDYPRDLIRIMVVDGGSIDGTQALVAAYAAADPRVTLIHAGVAGKTAQLNVALDHADTAWILVTDADARLQPDAVRRMVDATRADARVVVVGTTAAPSGGHPLDTWHWRLSNLLRRLEVRWGGTTGLVVAPCYLFRRGLIDRFPHDAAADDVFTACEAARQGGRCALVSSQTQELRSAVTLRGWIAHKHRRAVAYLREVFRFLPGVGRMRGQMQAVFLWRALALTAVPPLLMALILAGAAAAGPWVSAGMAAGFLALSAGPRFHERPGGGVVVALALPIWLVCISTAALLSYPFVRLDASYSRTAVRIHETEATL